MIRLSDLRGAKVETTDGKTLGHVHEVHCDNGRITAVVCGPGSFIERLTAKTEGRRIPWEFIRKLEHNAIIVTLDPPPRLAKKKSSASRSRQGTRRTSGRPSRR